MRAIGQILPEGDEKDLPLPITEPDVPVVDEEEEDDSDFEDDDEDADADIDEEDIIIEDTEDIEKELGQGSLA